MSSRNKKGGRGPAGRNNPPAGASGSASAPLDTSALYLELSQQQSTGDWDKALKTVNRILNADPVDPTGFHCRLVCLLQLGKFDQCLQQLDEREKLVKQLDVAFERAYALYRLNRPHEALDVLASAPSSTKVQELQAQVFYRLERYDEAFAMYQRLLKNTSDDFETERLTNLSAAAVHATKTGQFEAKNHLETYEQRYNMACHLLNQGKWLEAEKALEKALDACLKFLKEDDDEEVDEEDIERETGILKVQLAFTRQMQGREREAQSMYNEVLKSKPADIGLVAVASNNLLTLNKDQNIFDSKKRIKAATADGLEHKLTSKHRLAVARNQALLAMYTNQVDVCRQLMRDVAEQFGQNALQEDEQLIEAGVLSRAGRTQEAVDVLLGKKKNADLERVLMATQIYLEKNQLAEASRVLEDLPKEDRYRTGILSALVTLYLAQNDRGRAAALLKEAVAWNKKAKGQGNDDMAVVWRKTAEFHLKGDEPSVAAQSLEELLKTSPNDRQTLAQLVLAYAKFDLKKALDASKKLPDFSQGDVDVEALESSAFLGANKYGKKAARPGGLASPKPGAPSPKSPGDELLRKKRTQQRKRKKRLPKNYNPDVDPDPERWLPRRERTGYRRPRKDRRKGDKFTGAQGTAAGQSETFDYSKKSASAAPATGAVPKNTPKSPEAPVGPRQQQRKPQPKKKGKNKNRF